MPCGYETETVADLVFDVIIRQAVPLLEHQHVKHQHDIDGLGTGITFSGLVMPPD
ncbi:hypothetical protein [Methyloglobulus sp.]|uniref:hypothetical protein n=1 Tax=Methyloglobulus sp. TaxID=2518622 RepID=UPI0032B7EE4F